jgi:signal transduction histidine kinase
VHTQLDYFRPGRLLPSLPRGLVLTGLVAATAAAWLAATTGLRFAARDAGPRRGPWLPALGLVAALVSLAAAPAGFPAWAPVLVPLAGALVPWLAPRDVRTGRPTRVLLTSVLATGLLFPALWVRVSDAARETVLADVSHLVGREEVVAADLRVDLATLADDPHLLDALARLERGEPPPEGLALHAWQRLGLGARPEGASVRVVDSRYGTVDRFWLDTPPASRLPRSLPLEPAEDVVVLAGIEAPGKVRSVVGDVRVGGAAEGRPVGRVVVVVPDPLSAELLGIAPARLPRDPEGFEGARGERLALTLVRDGAVVASNEPALPPSFRDLPDLSGVESPRWVAGPAHERLAFPLPDGRGVLLAARPRGSEHVVLSLARTSIVGVGLGAALALLVFAVTARGFRPGLQHRILLSYFAVSVVPLALLGAASLRSATARHEQVFRERHSLLVSAAREDLAALGASLFDFASEDVRLEGYAGQRGIDLTVYREGGVVGSSLSPLLAADLLPVRLPAEAYRATELEGRDALGRDETFAGRPVRVGYAPLRDERGRPVATVSVPLLHDPAPAALEAAATGSVLLAAYLLTLVLVVVVGVTFSRGIARPVDLLAEGTKRVAAGEEDVVLPEAGGAEMAALVAAFNRMTRDLKEVRARAAKAERDAAWKGMARQVAHEIKNPLTPMRLMLQHLLAASREDPAKGAALVEPTARIVLEQIDALRRIAGDFGSFAGAPRRVPTDVDVNRLLASLAALYAAGSPPGVRIETALATSLPPVRADEDELRRALLNLVGNAVEALDGTAAGAADGGRADGGGPSGTVALRSERARGPGAKDGVRVTVEDTGVGIPPEHRARLFEPAFSTKSSGTGLGLAIVRRVVTDLSGTIDLESEVGKGTRVSVWLPAAGTEPLP